MRLSEKMIALMEASTTYMNDREQRSALGIADSWVRGTNADCVSPKIEDGVPRNRDGLAACFIDLMVEEGMKDDHKKALREARQWLNAPFTNDPKMLAWRAERAAKGDNLKAER